jgi:hypothetical protein
VSDGIRTRDRRDHNPSDGVCEGVGAALARGFSTLPYPLVGHNRRRTPHAAFQTLPGLSAIHQPSSYRDIIDQAA